MRHVLLAIYASLLVLGASLLVATLVTECAHAEGLPIQAYYTPLKLYSRSADGTALDVQTIHVESYSDAHAVACFGRFTPEHPTVECLYEDAAGVMAMFIEVRPKEEPA